MSGNGGLILPSGGTIIGQPLTVKTWACHVVGQCNCAGKEPVLISLGQIGICPGCHRKFQILRIAYDAQTGQAAIHVGLVLTRDDPAALPYRE